MKITFKLQTFQQPTADGFAIKVVIAHQGKIKQELIARAHPEHWLPDESMISVKHPDYDVLAPMMADLKIRARKVMLERITDIQIAHHELFKKKYSQVNFIQFAVGLIADMKQTAENVGRADLKAKNRMMGNVKVYENVISQFEPFAVDLPFENIDYSVLMRFRQYQTGIGNKNATIHLYLRTLRSIYNKAQLKHKFQDEKPFTGVFAGLKTKSYSSRKKSLDRDALLILESLDLKSEKQKYVDLFLLQFYFGGADLIDVYYLKKKQIRRGRVFFQRSKVPDGPPIDLKIHPKAALILKKYGTDDDWLFPWKKERESYEVFRRTFQRGLIYVQKLHNIEVLPDGGNIAVKVARHTFANLAKRLMIHEDIIRELMGHERDDTDNFYKDRYDEAVRDKALFDIIGD